MPLVYVTLLDTTSESVGDSLSLSTVGGTVGDLMAIVVMHPGTDVVSGAAFDDGRPYEGSSELFTLPELRWYTRTREADSETFLWTRTAAGSGTIVGASFNIENPDNLSYGFATSLPTDFEYLLIDYTIANLLVGVIDPVTTPVGWVTQIALTGDTNDLVVLMAQNPQPAPYNFGTSPVYANGLSWISF